MSQVGAVSLSLSLSLFRSLPPSSFFFNFKFILFSLLLLHWVFIAVHRLSLVLERRGFSLAAVRELLIAVASLIAEQGS